MKTERSWPEIRTKRYGLVLFDVSESVDHPESGMRPNRRVFGYEFAPSGDNFEVVYSYFREGNNVEIFIGRLP